MRNETALKVSIKAFGPTTEQLEAIGAQVAGHASVRKFVGHAKARLLYVETIDDDGEEKNPRPTTPTRFRATLYDDKGQRAIVAEGSLRTPRSITLSESGTPPAPSALEFATALKIVHAHRELGPSIASGETETYQPIPAVLTAELPDGRFERRIAVGLISRGTSRPHEIVGVSLMNRDVLRFAELGPAGVRPPNFSLCGVPQAADQPTAGKGTAGQVWVTITQGGQTLWRFLAVRPAASSGTNGSAIELRYVDFKGKRVLYRAHVPILNVKYDQDACGPYRDWQYQEGMIQAQGVDVAPGFRLCSSPAQTIMDTGSDTGNFLGVGIFIQNNEVVFVSEMQAGWYRYVSQWRFAANGTLKPRFGFAAVESPCVCNVHHHHVYWRLDFDIRTAGNNRVREFNDPPIIGNSKWHEKHFEIRRPRDFARKRKWRVENASTGEGYEIVPQSADGIATAQPDWPFGRGDVWILRYHGNEIDDGSVAIGPPYEAGLDAWVNGESVLQQDVVIWYGAHFTHDVSHEDPAQHGHIVGPDLKPVGW